MSQNTNILRYLDWPTVGMYIAMIIFGWLNIYGASHDLDQTSIFDFAYYSGKQFIWIITSLLLAIVILLIDGNAYRSLSMPLYIVTILVLIATIFLAHTTKGSNSWLALGPIKFQPAEISKFVTALAVANVMGQYGFKLDNLRNYAKVCLLILLPMLIIILQKETGSALVYLSFMLMLYREGLPGLFPFAALCCIILFVIVIRFDSVPFAGVESASLGMVVAFALMLGTALLMALKYRNQKTPISFLIYGLAALFVPTIVLHLCHITINFVYVLLGALLATAIYMALFAIKARCRSLWIVVIFICAGIIYCYSASYLFEHVLQPHQQLRIEVLLGIKDDPKGAGYNVQQAKIAIGSGGFLGKGFLNGTQTTLKFVPEQHTDFIFCTVGEEYGFLGVTGVLIFYLFFLYRLINIAERQRETFVRVYGYSIVGIFLMHIMINVGMVIGLMPVIGIPLPFFSYGGSSLWAFTIMLFIFLRLDIAQKQKTH